MPKSLKTMDISLCKLQEIVKDREAWHVAVHRVAESDLVTEQQKLGIISPTQEVI